MGSPPLRRRWPPPPAPAAVARRRGGSAAAGVGGWAGGGPGRLRRWPRGLAGRCWLRPNRALGMGAPAWGAAAIAAAVAASAGTGGSGAPPRGFRRGGAPAAGLAAVGAVGAAGWGGGLGLGRLALATSKQGAWDGSAGVGPPPLRRRWPPPPAPAVVVRRRGVPPGGAGGCRGRGPGRLARWPEGLAGLALATSKQGTGDGSAGVGSPPLRRWPPAGWHRAQDAQGAPGRSRQCLRRPLRMGRRG